MTYLAFHAVFLLPPILALAWLNRGVLGRVHPRAGLVLGGIAALALVYTTPWDNYLVYRGIWDYGPDRVIGTIGYVPLEEYLFFVLQPVLTGLWLFWLLGRAGSATSARAGADRRVGGTVVYGGLAVLGLLLLRFESGTYLGLILAWAAPVLALQWLYAGPTILRRRTALILGVAAPTLYLWVADAVAIHLGIWRISEIHSLGPALGPLPLEEAVFFLVTNLLVVQGLLLFLYPARAAGRKAGATSDTPSVSSISR